METNAELELAWRCIERTGNTLIFDRKSRYRKNVLKQLKERSHQNGWLYLAPTGIAAINAGGVTIHSFFQLPFAPYIPEQNLVQINFLSSAKKNQHYT